MHRGRRLQQDEHLQRRHLPDLQPGHGRLRLRRRRRAVGSTCGASLVCAPNGSCIAATTTCDSGVSGSVGQTCAAQHRACVADPSLGTGSCAGCAAGFVDEGGTCRAVKTCGDLTCTGTGQTCVAAGANSDAFCGCAAAYLPDGSGGCRLRVTCAALGCATSGRTCSDNAGADSVCGACLATHVDVGGTCYPSCTTLGCAAAGKTCSTSGIPACGACLGGWLPNSSGTCVDVVTCSEISCPVGVCVEGNADSHSNATCDTEGSCSATQVRQPGGQCVTCTDCDGIDDPAGSTGDHYSSPAGDGTCVCKTQPAWFVSSLSGHPVLPCDADGDGWVRRSAYDAKGSPFPEVQAEATCDVRKIDRFLLMPDEPGGKPVVVMVDDLGTDSGVESDGLNHYVELYEPDVLDDDARVAQAHVAGSSVENHLRLQPYGLVQQTPTRRFVASELNPLTKYCNHQDDDYNWDFVSDATEWYRSVPVPPPGGNLTWMTPFVRMSYFGELNRGYYVPPGGNATIPSTCQAVRWVGAAWTAKPCVGLAGSGYGAWVVQEKRRVAGAPDTLRLELASAVSEPTSATAGYGVSHDLRDASYWRSCRRNRPATFDASLPPDTSPSTPTIGARNLDFARFSCPDRTRGACYSSDPLMRPNDVSVPYDGRLPAGPRVNALADRVSFAGMNHPSQFRCMRPVPQPTQVADPSDQIAANALQTPDHLDARFQLVECGLSANASLRDAPPDGSSVNPRDPAIECRLDNVPVAPASQGYFQWVVTRHATYARDAEGTPAYALGCIDEAVEWPFLCDGFHRDPFLNRATPTADATNFGHLQCGCGQSGGAACEVGCPTADAVHAQTSPPYDPTSRAGYWLCGEAGIMTPEYDPATYAGMAPGDLPPGLMTVTAPSPDGSGTSGVWSLRVETRSTQPVLPGTTRACATLTTEIGTTGTVCVSP
ncbi:MAG: hypothetical protein U1F43_30515 [Myxococcota bacterium]